MTAAMTMTPTRASEVLRDETLGAWAEYLHATRDQPHARYLEVEPWAWKRLQSRLRATEARRQRLIGASPRRTDAAEGSSPAGGDEDDGA